MEWPFKFVEIFSLCYELSKLAKSSRDHSNSHLLLVLKGFCNRDKFKQAAQYGRNKSNQDLYTSNLLKTLSF